MAKAPSRVTASSSIDEPSAKHPRRHAATIWPEAHSTTRPPAHRYRSPSSQSASSPAVASTTTDPAATDGGSGPDAIAKGRAPGIGAQSCPTAEPRSTTTSAPSAAHPEGHSPMRSHGHVHSVADPRHGMGRVARRDAETSPPSHRAMPSGQSTALRGIEPGVFGAGPPSPRSASHARAQPRSHPASARTKAIRAADRLAATRRTAAVSPLRAPVSSR